MKHIKSLESLAKTVKNQKPCNEGGPTILYERVSTPDQALEGYSLAAQRDILVKHAEKIGKTSYCLLQDTESASKAGRRNYNKILEFYWSLPDGSYVPPLIVEKVDRLTRNKRDDIELEDLILAKGVELHSVKEGSVLRRTSSASEKLMHGNKVLYAEYFSNNLSEETLKGMKTKVKQGGWPGRAPIGYLNVRGPDRKNIIIQDPDCAPLIKKIFEWYVYDGYSMDSIAKLATQHGLRTPFSGKPVHSAMIYKILHRPTYMGEIIWGGVRGKGAFEPIISEELFYAAKKKAARKSPYKSVGKITNHTYTFTRLLTCGYCGCAMVGELKKGKYIYFHCTGSVDKECPNKKHYVRQEKIEEKVIESISLIHLDKDTLDFVINEIKKESSAEITHYHQTLSRLETELENARQNLLRLSRLYVKGKVGEEEHDNLYEELTGEAKELQTNIAHFRAMEPENFEDGIRLLELMQEAVILYKNQPMEEKRRLIRIIHSNLSWKDGKLEAEYRKAFKLLAVKSCDSNEKRVTSVAGGDPYSFWRPQGDSNPRSRRERAVSWARQ